MQAFQGIEQKGEWRGRTRYFHHVLIPSDHGLYAYQLLGFEVNVGIDAVYAPLMKPFATLCEGFFPRKGYRPSVRQVAAF